ncbi:hypothetical protein [Caulobacter hibisci]|uniref:Uncharacterized protein n=1 Tax=Caulobacter hibisci TaxID=2035993 RepID=A0ABS0T3E5_9CAUL|nr:hypothetical protein [Caulobacter hibisci]MBI1686411.1 hypothetical protein [Caulobacter hibisci]
MRALKNSGAHTKASTTGDMVAEQAQAGETRRNVRLAGGEDAPSEISPAIAAQAWLESRVAEPTVRPLPLAVRVVVVVGGTAALWAAIIGFIF